MPTVGLNFATRRNLITKKHVMPNNPKMIRPKTTDMMIAGSICFLGVEIGDVPGGSAVVESATAGCLLDVVISVVAAVAVGRTVVMTVVTVVGTVVTSVVKSCCTVVIVTPALVTVIVLVTETAIDVVTEDEPTFPFTAESAPMALGVSVSFAVPRALGVGAFLSRSGTLGVGRSLPVPGTLCVDMSFPTAGKVGADWSFPVPFSFPFLGDKTDPKDPRTDLEKSFMFSDL